MSVDFIATGLGYVLTAAMVYICFAGSQLFRIRYIEHMRLAWARWFHKSLEYVFGGYCLYGCFELATYQGPLYYGLDLLWAGLLIRHFVQTDAQQRAEFTRLHQHSEQKKVNRLIVNLGHSVFGQDN